MKKYVTKDGWSQKIIRISPEYEKLCLFIDFWAKDTEREVATIYDEIFNYSLSKLISCGFHYKLAHSYEIKVRREPKGFSLSKETKEKLDRDFKLYSTLITSQISRSLTLGEFAELLIYIYCEDNFDKRYKDFIKMDWGITKIKGREDLKEAIF